jgi:hypothetical protein
MVAKVQVFRIVDNAATECVIVGLCHSIGYAPSQGAGTD